jgi:hypothetical protein
MSTGTCKCTMYLYRTSTTRTGFHLSLAVTSFSIFCPYLYYQKYVKYIPVARVTVQVPSTGSGTTVGVPILPDTVASTSIIPTPYTDYLARYRTCSTVHLKNIPHFTYLFLYIYIFFIYL